MDAGQLTIRRGDKQGGLDLMLEAVSLYETIHALFHKDVARAYNSYAVAVHSIYRFALNEKQVQLQAKGDEVTEEDKQAPVEFAQELQQALRFQRQAVIIAERTLGLDHPETLGYYVTLAMLEVSRKSDL
jgi:protein TIF31